MWIYGINGPVNLFLPMKTLVGSAHRQARVGPALSWLLRQLVSGLCPPCTLG